MEYHTYKLILREEPEGGYTVFVPSLEGCITYGETIDEAKKNAKEAIEVYLESLEADNQPIPSDNNILETNIQVSHG